MRSTSSRKGERALHYPKTVVVALGSNLGDRALLLRRAIEELKTVITVVRISSVYETDPVDAPPESPPFLNMVIAGHTRRSPANLLGALLAIETRLGRVRTARNAPRTIDLDLILYDAVRMRTTELTLPHPRYQERDFVLQPMREIGF